MTVPSFLNAGLRVGIFSGMALVGASSMSTTVSPLRPATVTGVISHLKLPSSVAARARRRMTRGVRSACCSSGDSVAGAAAASVAATRAPVASCRPIQPRAGCSFCSARRRSSRVGAVALSSRHWAAVACIAASSTSTCASRASAVWPAVCTRRARVSARISRSAVLAATPPAIKAPRVIRMKTAQPTAAAMCRRGSRCCHQRSDGGPSPSDAAACDKLWVMPRSDKGSNRLCATDNAHGC